MTYNQNVPNASQSPALFPLQNSINFARLQTIINADHVFNTTAQSTDGVHRQCTMIARAMPGSLPNGTNSILYSWVDGNGFTQLRFYNGTLDSQLTPPQVLYPLKVTGSASLTPNATATAFADPGYLWAGTGWAIIQSTNIFSFYNIIRSGNNDINELDSTSHSSTNPDLEFSGNNLLIRNNYISTYTCQWSLIINRIS